MRKHLKTTIPAVACLLLAAAIAVPRWPGQSLTASTPEEVEAPTPPPVSVKTAEVAVEFSLRLHPRPPGAARSEPLEGTTRFSLRDARTGEPLRGTRLLGWMTSRREGQPAPDEAQCKAHIRSFLEGRLATRAEVDLNSYLLLTLNQDATVSVIDPQVAFSRTRLKNLVTLGGQAVDWALRPDGQALYLTLPLQGMVSVVDLKRFVVARNIQVGREPRRVALAPGGRTAWVGAEGEGQAQVLDTATHEVVASLEVGAGRQVFAFGEEGRTAWVAASEGKELLAVDTGTYEVLARVEVGAGVGALAWSEQARALYVAQERTREVLVVDGTRREVAQRIALGAAPGELRFEPQGRWAFILHREAGQVSLVDSASNRVAHVLEGFAAPARLSFSEQFAYVHNTEDARLSLIELSSLQREGTPAVFQVTLGQRKPSLARGQALGEAVAVLPEGNQVVAVSPADRALFHYTEGMMAPSSAQLNYGREPLAVLLLDRSLREVEPGVHTAQAVVRENGTYDVHLLVDSPRTVACLEWKVEGVPEQASARHRLPLRLEPGFDPQQPLPAGVASRLRFRLTPTEQALHHQPLQPAELEVLMFRPPSGHWLVRPEVRLVGEGLFEVEVAPPEPGQYELLVGVPGRQVPLGRLPRVTLGAELMDR